MALSNAEKQAAWRTRREQRISVLERQVAELTAENERLRTIPKGKSSSKQSGEEVMQEELRRAQHELELASLARDKAVAEAKADIAGMSVEERIDYVLDLEIEIEDLKDRVAELEASTNRSGK